MTTVEFGRESYAKAVGVYKGAAYTSVKAKADRSYDLSQQLVWARRLAPMGFAIVVIGIVLHRFEFIPVQEMLAVIGVGGMFALLALGLSLSGFFDIWHNGTSGVFKGLAAFAIAILTIAPFFYVMASVVSLPRVNGVTTTLDNPPLLLTDIALQRQPVGTLEYQAVAYPEITAQEFDASIALTYRLALATATRQGFQITMDLTPVSPNEVVLTETEPLPRIKPVVLPDGTVLRRTTVQTFTKAPNVGHFQAVATTPLLGFKDDIAVTVIPGSSEGKARVDVRSMSRIGAHDLGTNARRVQDFQRELDLMLKATSLE